MADLVATFTARRGEFTVDVDLRCPPGITCVMGRSGSGKSTVLSVLAGLATPERGTIKLGDEVWVDRGRGISIPVHHRRLAYVFQGLALFPHMSALHSVTYGMHEAPRAARAPAARRSGSRSLAPSPALPSWCCSTSRSPRSTASSEPS